MADPVIQPDKSSFRHRFAPELTALRFWFPLAASWLLMSTETPIVTAVAARMADAKLQLAGFGVAFSLVLMVESPILSLLTAGNTLARDRHSLRLVRNFTLILGFSLTLILVVLDFTPLMGLVARRLIGVPEDVAGVARWTMIAMIPWPAAIAYRRFYQGVMIRHGYTRRMSYGTALRLSSTLLVSLGCMWWTRLSGAAVAGIALGCAVLVEATYVHLASRPAIRLVEAAAPQPVPLTLSGLLRFYAPLALTSMIMLSTTPLLNLGMARAPLPVVSLAVWPVVNGQLMQLRSVGFSMQEAIVALWERPDMGRALRRFSFVLGVGTSLLLLLIVLTPVGPWWQRTVAGLTPDLVVYAMSTLGWALLLPLLSVIQSWLRGLILVNRATNMIAWATVINMGVLVPVVLGGAALGWLPGASLAAVALTLSQIAETVWLWWGAYGRKLAAARSEPVQAG